MNPNFPAMVHAMAVRDQVVMLILMLSGVAFAFLVLARYRWPETLPVARYLLMVGFLGGLLLSLTGVLK